MGVNLVHMKKVFTIVGILIIGASGYYYLTSKNNYRENTTVPPTNIPQTTTPLDVIVSIKNYSFNPPTLAIKTGTKVMWINSDSASHTVTSDSSDTLNSDDLSNGQAFSHTFTNIGTTNYHCNIHPNMKGSVVVTN